MFSLLYIIFALWVEQNKTCYSDGATWQTVQDGNGQYTDVAADFNHILWGLGITSLLSGIIPILGTVHLGYFIWMSISIFSAAGKLCAEHVLTSRGTFLAVVFWFNISVLALLVCGICLIVLLARR